MSTEKKMSDDSGSYLSPQEVCAFDGILGVLDQELVVALEAGKLGLEG